MLKQLKSLGLSIVIGSMIITSVPTTTYSLNNNTVKQEQQITKFKKPSKKEIEKVTKLYKANVNSINNANSLELYKLVDDKLIEKFMNDKELYRLAMMELNNYSSEFYVKNGFMTCDDIYHVMSNGFHYRTCEQHKKFKKMNSNEKHAMQFVLKYTIAKNLKIKNVTRQCTDCHKYFVPCKDMVIAAGGINCGCEINYKSYNINIPKLTVSGLNAAYKNDNKVNRMVVVPDEYEENDKEIIAIFKDQFGTGKTLDVYNKNTRKFSKRERIEPVVEKDLSRKEIRNIVNKAIEENIDFEVFVDYSSSSSSHFMLYATPDYRFRLGTIVVNTKTGEIIKFELVENYLEVYEHGQAEYNMLHHGQFQQQK